MEHFKQLDGHDWNRNKTLFGVVSFCVGCGIIVLVPLMFLVAYVAGMYLKWLAS